jgi:hypothetical protein
MVARAGCLFSVTSRVRFAVEIIDVFGLGWVGFGVGGFRFLLVLCFQSLLGFVSQWGYFVDSRLGPVGSGVGVVRFFPASCFQSVLGFVSQWGQILRSRFGRAGGPENCEGGLRIGFVQVSYKDHLAAD